MDNDEVMSKSRLKRLNIQPGIKYALTLSNGVTHMPPETPLPRNDRRYTNGKCKRASQRWNGTQGTR